MSRKRASHQAPGTQRWLLLVAVLLAVGVGVAFATWGTGQPANTAAGGTLASGTLVPDHTQHEFGQVRMGGGLLVARFPLTVQGATLVNSVGTT
ncbi:MAG: hypothetical protein HY689_15425 [Chloroflexi bacterium]|nr:hypothetical protein [Chloroflexota bacterium]